MGVFSQLRTVTCKDFQSSFKKFRTFSCNNKIGFQDSSKTINCSKCTNHDPCNVMSLLLKDYFVVRRVNSTRFDSKNTWHVCSCAVKMGGGGGGGENWAGNLEDNKISCDKPRDLFPGDFSLKLVLNKNALALKH